MPMRSRRSRAAFFWLALLLALAPFAGPAAAADFSVYPVSPSFAGRPTTSFVVSNQSANPLRVQVQVFAWTQPDGADIDAATEEMIASPPFVELAAKENQTVRLLYRGKAPVDSERAFHVVVSELPDMVAANPGTSPRRSKTLNTAISFSMPVFLEPVQRAEAAPAIELARNADQSLQLRIANTGGRRAVIKSLVLQGPGGTAPIAGRLPVTVLAGGAIAMRLPAAGLQQLGSGLTARVTTEDRTYDVPVSQR